MLPDLPGDRRLVRLSVSLLGVGKFNCPFCRSVKARPLLARRRGWKPLEDFTLNPIMRALDEHELGLESRSSAPCHPIHRKWADEAVANYLNAREQDEEDRRSMGLAPMHPVKDEWVVVVPPRESEGKASLLYERTIWGRRYVSDDGSERELWLLSFNGPKKGRSEAEIAAAEGVLAEGAPATSEFGAPYKVSPNPYPRPATVRVADVGCGWGRVRFWPRQSAAAAQERYGTLARPAFAEVLSGSIKKVGTNCSDCSCIAGCPALPRAPEVLQYQQSRGRKIRSLAAKDLELYRQCPARYYLTRVLRIRGEREEEPEIVRGRMVDAWLNRVHAEDGTGSCRERPLPERLDGLTEKESRAALAMLAWHRTVCPLEGLAAGELRDPQRQVAFYDETAGVVLIATPDLIYTDREETVWRETKTAASRYASDISFMERYPQMAVAVLMVEAGAVGGGSGTFRIELETLYPDGAAREIIDPHDPPTRNLARGFVTETVAALSADTEFPARPGRGCRSCEARPWCDAAEGEE